MLERLRATSAQLRLVSDILVTELAMFLANTASHWLTHLNTPNARLTLA